MLSFKWLVNGIIVPADLTPADCTPAEAEGRYVGVPPAALRMEGGIAAKAAAAAGHIGTATGGAALTLHITRYTFFVLSFRNGFSIRKSNRMWRLCNEHVVIIQFTVIRCGMGIQ